jgi:riboflavin synthase
MRLGRVAAKDKISRVGRRHDSPPAGQLLVAVYAVPVFTGIVRERGRVVSFEDGRLVVESSLGPSVGDSISVDGTCLTVVEASNGRLSFDVVAETTARAKPYRSEVNLEPAVEVGQPLGGHYVQGHVDGVGRVRSLEDGRMTVEAPEGILRYCVEKGSIAVEGVALTIAGLDDDGFEVALVPHTLEVTTLGRLEPGDAVNLEVDILAKYVERLVQLAGLGSRRAEPGSTEA